MSNNPSQFFVTKSDKSITPQSVQQLT